jgi:hypothetical protein
LDVHKKKDADEREADTYDDVPPIELDAEGDRDDDRSEARTDPDVIP